MKYKLLIYLLILPIGIGAAEKAGKLLDYMSDVQKVLVNAKSNLINTNEFNPEPFVQLADNLIKNKPRLDGLNIFAQNPVNYFTELYAVYIANNPGLESIINAIHKGYRLYVIPKNLKEKNIRERAVIFFIYLFIETQLLPDVKQLANGDKAGRSLEVPVIEKANPIEQKPVVAPQEQTDYGSILKRYFGYLQNYFAVKK